MNQTSLVSMINTSAASLDKAAAALGEKAAWSPLDKGRSALNQIVECGGIMQLSAQTVSGQAFPQMPMEQMRAMRNAALVENDTLEKAVTSLHKGADALTAAVSATSDEDLQNISVTIPFGGGMVKTLAEVVAMCYWNNTYHEGQINYIETLL